MNDSRNEMIAATLLLLEDDLDLDDFQAVIEELNRHDLLQLVNNYEEVLLNKDGSKRKVNRVDYSRKKKRIKNSNPWDDLYWLNLISDPNVRDPSHSSGIEFRRMFRTPFPVFEDIDNLNHRRCRFSFLFYRKQDHKHFDNLFSTNPKNQKPF